MDPLIKLAEDIGEIKGVSKATLEQARKTNGHVAELFKRMNAVERVQASCPIKNVQKVLDTINRETEVTRFYQKYPKLLRWTVIGLVFMLLVQVVTTLTVISGRISKNNEQTEQRNENDNMGQWTRQGN